MNTKTISDTPREICSVLLGGMTPDELIRYAEERGFSVDLDVLREGAELAVAELKRQGQRDLAHADALEKFGLEKWGRDLWVAAAEPDPLAVKLQDGRLVARKFYDPLIHGPVVE